MFAWLLGGCISISDGLAMVSAINLFARLVTMKVFNAIFLFVE